MLTVYSQKELDEALKNGKYEFEIKNFRAELWGNSRAVLWGNSRAVLQENSRAVLRGNSSAELRGNSSAELWGNSSAVLWENSRAVLQENSRAELWGNSSAVLWGNSSAVLYDFSHVFHNQNTIKIKMRSNKTTKTNIYYPSDIKEWCKLKGIRIKNKRIMLWKVTKKDGTDFKTGKINYSQKGEIICPDWVDNHNEECGNGLHLGDSPSGCRYFYNNDQLKTARLFKVSANINDCVCWPGNPEYPMKIRVKKCRMVKEYPIDYIQK